MIYIQCLQWFKKFGSDKVFSAEAQSDLFPLIDIIDSKAIFIRGICIIIPKMTEIAPVTFPTATGGRLKDFNSTMSALHISSYAVFSYYEFVSIEP